MSDEIVPSAPEPEDAPDELEPHVEPQLEPQPVSQTRFVFTPPIDIYETDEGLILKADLPGVCLETLELQVQDNKLTLFGRVQPHVPELARPVHQEFEVGDFLRSFILSGEIDHERISATLNHGVLKVTLPRMPRSEPRRIQVNSD